MKHRLMKKLGDVFCDIGKYMLTVVPFTYLMSEKPGELYIAITTTISGVLFILYGLYFISHSDSVSVSGKKKKKTK